MDSEQLARQHGWRAAYDSDETPPLLVVYHPDRSRHFTGETAWTFAVQLETKPTRGRLWEVVAEGRVIAGDLFKTEADEAARAELLRSGLRATVRRRVG